LEEASVFDSFRCHGTGLGWMVSSSPARIHNKGSIFEGSVLSICKKPYFGVKGGERVFLKILGNGESVSSLEDAREELSFSFAELEDFALENRSICFNSLDRKQMDEVFYLFIILSLNEQK